MENRWDDLAAAGLTDELAELIYLSHLVGADVTLTQPGGGNSSVKRREVDFAGRTVDVLRVKGSGTDLRTIGASGFSGLRMEDLAFLRKRDSMTDEVVYCFEDQEYEDAAALMRQHQVRRLPVVNREKRLVGVVSLGDVSLRGGDSNVTAQTVEDVSTPSKGESGRGASASIRKGA